ncbi:hypothetical protein B932_3323 [Gluconobacter oxydans H24]|nr:hypothetical protein B932_3323 [Gluconobacter oxydans H24]
MRHPAAIFPAPPDPDDVDRWQETASGLVETITRHFGVTVTPDAFNAIADVTSPPR